MSSQGAIQSRGALFRHQEICGDHRHFGGRPHFHQFLTLGLASLQGFRRWRVWGTRPTGESHRGVGIPVGIHARPGRSL